MKKPSRLDYAYSVGRVRVLEKKLVQRAVFSEAVEEKDFPRAVKVVFDAGEFPEEMVNIKDSTELDDFLESEEEKLVNLLDEIILEKDILEIFLEEKVPGKALEISQRTGYSFIHDYLRHKIDLANLKIFCRLKYSGAGKEKFEKLVLEGGFLDERILILNFEAAFTDVGERIQATPYRELWNRGVDSLEEKETFIDLERGIEDFMMTYLRKAKYIVFGPEPVFAYGLAKRRELSLLRFLGVGKLSEIPDQLLKQRMSATYV